MKVPRRKMVLEKVEDNLGKAAADEKEREKAEIDSRKTIVARARARFITGLDSPFIKTKSLPERHNTENTLSP